MEELIKEIKELKFNSQEYWKLRCKYLEKHIDPTYSKQERDNCYMLWNMIRRIS
jgi:CRISPR/Cas system-associated protein Csx1